MLAKPPSSPALPRDRPLPMRFSLIDRIVELKRGEKIVAVKSLSLAEEYLADHFPRFPVLPGVFMIEAMSQAATWLIREQEDFANSVVILKEAKNIKYSGFVFPGDTLTVEATVVRHDDRETTLKVKGSVGDNLCVGGRLVLERYNLADEDPSQSPRDDYTRGDAREQFALIGGPAAAEADLQETVGS